MDPIVTIESSMQSTPRFPIGDLATATNVKVVTIRYYEQIGLLKVPPRSAGHYRTYNEAHVGRLRFIRRCRDLGFTLDQVRDLLRLASEQDQNCSEVDRLTVEHLAEIERKIADLERLADELRRLSTCCKGNQPIADCRIIEALSPKPGKQEMTSL